MQMKHKISVTLVILLIFFIAQTFGILTFAYDAKVFVSEGDVTITHPDTAIGERPTQTNLSLIIWISIGVAIGTVLVLLLAKFKQTKIWAVWYTLAIFICIATTLGVFIDSKMIVFAISAILSGIKVWKREGILANTIEILVYSAIAIIVSPLLNVFWAIILLLGISVYDFVAVRLSKHMVTLAEFQKGTKLFAGIQIGYNAQESKDEQSKVKRSAKTAKRSDNGLSSNRESKNKDEKEHKTAILGGGDIAFPLILNATYFHYVLSITAIKSISVLICLIVVLFQTLALFFLFWISKKGKYYPAMPYLTFGSIVGLLASLIFI